MIIRFHTLNNPIRLLEQLRDRWLLLVAQLGHQPATRPQKGPAFARQLPVKEQTIRPSIESRTGIVVAHLRFQALDLRARDVRRVGKNEIELQIARHCRKTVAPQKLDPVGDPMPLRIFTSHGERRLLEIKRVATRGRDFQSERDRQAAAPGSKIENGAPRTICPKKLPRLFGEQFRFRTRNQDITIDGKFEPAKRAAAKDMLERFPRAAFLDERSQLPGLGLGEAARKIQVEIQPRDFEQMRDQEFGLQTRRADPLFAQELRAALNHFQDRHSVINTPESRGRKGLLRLREGRQAGS